MEYLCDPYKGTGREARTDHFDRTSCWHLCNFECCGHDVTVRQSCRQSKQYCRLLLMLFARSGSKNLSPSLAEPSHQLLVLSENRIRRFIKFYLLRALACRHTHNEFHNLGLFAFRHGFNLFDYVSGIHAKYVVDGKRSDKGSGAKLGDILGDKPLCAFIPVA
jgi:hypothetical protein